MSSAKVNQSGVGMPQKRIRSSRFPGVYYRDTTDPRRRHNGRPDRCYDFCYRIGGKLKWVTVGWISEGFSEQKAANMRRELLERLAQGEEVHTAKQADITLDMLADDYFSWLRDEGKYAEQESLRYNAHIREEIGFLPLRILAQQDSDHVQILKRRLLERMAPASARRILGDCRAMINRGIKKGRWSGINPFGKERLEMPRLQNKGERFLSCDEAKSLLAALARRSPQLHDMAWLSLRTGLRSTEIFRLTGADLDEEHLTIWVTEKGRSRVPIRVDADVMHMLRAYRSEPCDYVFKARGGGKITAISDTFDRACVEVGLMPSPGERKDMDTRKKVWFHTLRHTFASWLAQSGKVTIHELREIMRHKSVDMTERYAHLIPGQVQEKTALIGTILRGD